MSELILEIRSSLSLCEYYLNNSAPRAVSKQYYTRMRKRVLKTLIAVQLEEFQK